MSPRSVDVSSTSDAGIERRLSVLQSIARLTVWEYGFQRRVFQFDTHGGSGGVGLGESLDAIRAMVHPVDCEEFDRAFQPFLNGHSSDIETVFRIKTEQGGWRWQRLVGEVVQKSDQGDPELAVGTLQDIDDEVTARELLELERLVLSQAAIGRNLHESLHRFALGVESIWDGVLCAINLYASERRTLHFGAAPSLPDVYRETVEGFPVDDMPSVCGDAIVNRDFRYISDFENAPAHFEESLPFYHELGVRGCWSIPVFAGREMVATFCVFTLEPRVPTSEDKHFLRRLAQAVGLLLQTHEQNKRQRELDSRVERITRLKSLGQLAEGIAHDFNNLLCAILANAEVIQHTTQSDSQVSECASQICKASNLAADLCQKMLTYAGKPSATRDFVDLPTLVGDVVDIVKSGTPPHVEFELECHPDCPPVFGEEAMLSQAVLNLVSNSVDAIGDSTGTVKVTVGFGEVEKRDLNSLYTSEFFQEETCAFIRVEDDGSGIEKATLDSIFEPFFSTKPDGKGLGLSMVFGAVKRHFGAIGVTTEIGKGTEFCFYLPLAKRDAEEAVADIESLHFEPDQPRQVLIVEDNDTVRASLTRLLESRGNNVRPFDSGESLLMDLDQIENADVVLLDIHLMGLSGLETYRAIRDAGFSTPVCFITGLHTEEMVDVLKGDPHCTLIEKPVTYSQLTAAIQQAFQRV